mgnify:FL=1
MILKKLTLRNFRQFKDPKPIEFSQDEDKNITLILGDNTSGKTTLLQAFLWCLYGTANFKSKDSLLNAEIAQELIKSNENVEICVSLEIEHQDISYFITRKLNHSVKSGKVIPSNISKVTMNYIEKGKN